MKLSNRAVSSESYIAYFRVSTKRQGRSGLGLDAQRTAVEQFLKRRGGTLKAEFTEIQSGKNDSRPQLADALKLCRLTNSILLIAKLDRLSRNVAFLATLQQSSTRFIACDLPEANELVVHILAAVAQAERKAISERTKAALAAARERGVLLGNPHLRAGTAATADFARKSRSAMVESRTKELKDLIVHARNCGCVSLREIANQLNGIGITAPSGGEWHANTVRRLEKRLSLM